MFFKTDENSLPPPTGGKKIFENWFILTSNADKNDDNDFFKILFYISTVYLL
jgi:hypothetical protein